MKTLRNSWRIIGHVATEPKIQDYPEKKRQRFSFTVIVNEYYKTKQGEKVDVKTAVQVTRWFPSGKKLENLTKVFSVGAQVACEGRPRFTAFIRNEDQIQSADTFAQLNCNDAEVITFAKKEHEQMASEVDQANNENYTSPEPEDDDLPF